MANHLPTTCVSQGLGAHVSERLEWIEHALPLADERGRVDGGPASSASSHEPSRRNARERGRISSCREPMAYDKADTGLRAGNAEPFNDDTRWQPRPGRGA